MLNVYPKDAGSAMRLNVQRQCQWQNSEICGTRNLCVVVLPLRDRIPALNSLPDRMEMNPFLNMKSSFVFGAIHTIVRTYWITRFNFTAR
jgi:hypothetical protein